MHGSCGDTRNRQAESGLCCLRPCGHLIPDARMIDTRLERPAGHIRESVFTAPGITCQQPCLHDRPTPRQGGLSRSDLARGELCPVGNIYPSGFTDGMSPQTARGKTCGAGAALLLFGRVRPGLLPIGGIPAVNLAACRTGSPRRQTTDAAPGRCNRLRCRACSSPRTSPAAPRGRAGDCCTKLRPSSAGTPPRAPATRRRSARPGVF